MQTLLISTPGPQGPQGIPGPSGSLANFSGSAEITGSLQVIGSVSISDILTLSPQHPLPINVPSCSFAVSSSFPPKPYFWDGSSWNALF